MKKIGKTLAMYLVFAVLMTGPGISTVAAEITKDQPDAEDAATVSLEESTQDDVVYSEDSASSAAYNSGDQAEIPESAEEAVRTDTVSEDTVSDNDVSENVVNDANGYLYEPKSEYNVSFVAHNLGETKTLTYKIPASATAVKVTDFLGSLGKYEEVMPSMGGFLDIEDEDSIIYWSMSGDGVDNGEGYYLDECEISGGRDYVFTAHLCRRAAENIYVEITPQVYYNSRSHVLYNSAGSKTNSPDIYMRVAFHKDDKAGAAFRYLTPGTDYSISYMKNKEPSKYMNFQGEYFDRYEKGEGPCVVITGKGNYAGFSAKAFFDIVPHNFSSEYPLVKLSGLKKAYSLKDGKMNEKIDPKASMTWEIWGGKKYVDLTENLKKDEDYEVRLYRYDEINNVWVKQENGDPNQITKTGDYLYTLWGKGIKYCGVAFDGSFAGEFSEGTSGTIVPEHYSYSGMETPESAAFQFRVSGDIYQNLSNATITVKKPTIKFDGKLHKGDDFGLQVSIGKGSEKRNLTEGVDYSVVYDGNDFDYITKREYISGVGYLYSHGTCNAVYNTQIGIANTYKITINAIDGSGYYGTKTDKTVTIKGFALTAKGFEKSKPLEFNGQNQSHGVKVSKYGAKNGLKYYGADSLGYESDGTCKYLQNITANPGYYSSKYYTVLSSYYNAAPGTYSSTLYPIGGEVYHGKSPSIPFTRKKISLKKAVQKGYVSLSIGQGQYNAGGAMPGAVTVTFCGKAGSAVNVDHNGQRIYTPYTNYMATSFIVKMSDNKKAGDGAGITLSDSSYFTGSYKFKYSVSPATLTQTNIPVVNGNSWYRDQGRSEDKTLSAEYYDYGQLVAEVSASKKNPNGTELKPGISLYQTYYKNIEDRNNGKLSLAQIKGSQFKLNKKDESDGECSLEVQFDGTPLITGFEVTTLPVDSKYSEYASSAKITGATVFYNGQTYEFGGKGQVSLPYEGRQIRFDRETGDDKGVISVTLADGTKLGKDDFNVIYGDNLAAKKNGGSFTVILKRNEKTKKFLYGGSATFKFTISDAKGITI